MTATKRAPVKTVNKTASAVAKNAAAEKARKAASKAALKAADPKELAKAAVSLEKQASQPTPEALKAKADADHAAYLQTLREDAAALGVDPDTYIAEQLAPVKTKYNGPMLALKTARKAYVKAANGIQCNGDDLAVMCGQYPRETVVKGLIQALGLPGNPYLSLNPGQQSMNLRNKARHALKAGLVTSGHVALCLKAAAGK